MKNKIILMALLVSSLFMACNDDEYDAPNTFADAGWYTSLFRDAEMYTGINKYISFSDLSQGTIDHSWTITPNSYFLEGPIERTDSIYDQFIVNPGSLVSTEETIHVLFKEGGLKTVNLYNTFKDSVAFRGYKKSFDDNDDNDYYVMPSVKIGDKWVIDTTFVVDVYDTIVPKILIRQNGEVVSHENSSDVISIEAGDNLEFVDITTTGRPNTRNWNVAGTNKSDSVATIVFKKLGDWTGTFNSSRTGQNIPAGYAKYDIPATFRVIPSSKPFELFGKIVELEDETIRVPFNGEFAPFVAQEEFFVVTVNGVEFPISSVTRNADDATLLDIVMTDPIYRPDVITVTLKDGSDLESTDTRKPVPFTDVAVNMHNVNLWDNQIYGFEDGPEGAWISTDADLVEYSTEQAATGNYSLKLTNTTGWTRSSAINVPAVLEGGVTYTVTWKVWIDEGSTAGSYGPWFYHSTGDQQFWQGLNGKPRGEWITNTRDYEVPATGPCYFAVRINAGGIIYIDDVKIVKAEARP